MNRLARMDGLRGVLAVYVMLGHALPLTDLPNWLTTPFSHGEAAVDLFFALSGLVLVNSLERFAGQFWPFMAARARRLLPVYWLSLALSLVLLASGDPLRTLPWVGLAGRNIFAASLPPHLPWHILAHLFLAQGLIPQGFLPFAYVTLLGPAWSLSTEWQFYIVMALFAPRRLSLFALGFLAAGIAWHFVVLPAPWRFSRAFLPDAAPFFALGLASAAALRGGNWRVFALCLIITCALGLAAGHGKFLIPLLWAAAMLAQRRPWGAILEWPAIQFLGAISYPLYLLNEPVERALAIALSPYAHGNGPVFTLLWLPFTLATALLAAAGMHRFVEKPLMRQRKKILLPVIAAAAPQ